MSVYLCLVCRWLCEADDIEIRIGGSNQCVCRRCSLHMAEDRRMLTAGLRREVEAVLAGTAGV